MNCMYSSVRWCRRSGAVQDACPSCPAEPSSFEQELRSLIEELKDKPWHFNSPREVASQLELILEEVR